MEEREVALQIRQNIELQEVELAAHLAARLAGQLCAQPAAHRTEQSSRVAE